MTEVRNVAVARLRDAGVRRGELPAGHRGHAGALPPLRPGVPGARRGGHRAPGRGLPAHRPGRLQAADRRTDPGRHRHPDGVRSRPSALRTGSRARGDRGDHRVAQARGHLSAAGAPPRRRLHRRLRPAPGRIRTPRRPPRAAPAALQPVHPLADEGARRARAQHLGAAARRRRRHQGDRAADRLPRPRQPATARQRHHLQLPPAPAALRTHRAGRRRTAGPRDDSASTRTGRIRSPRRATRSSTR